jgi:hypothetical protein
MLSEPVVWRDHRALGPMEDFPVQPIAEADYPNPETTFRNPKDHNSPGFHGNRG